MIQTYLGLSPKVSGALSSLSQNEEFENIAKIYVSVDEYFIFNNNGRPLE